MKLEITERQYQLLLGIVGRSAIRQRKEKEEANKDESKTETTQNYMPDNSIRSMRGKTGATETKIYEKDVSGFNG